MRTRAAPAFFRQVRLTEQALEAAPTSSPEVQERALRTVPQSRTSTDRDGADRADCRPDGPYRRDVVVGCVRLGVGRASDSVPAAGADQGARSRVTRAAPGAGDSTQGAGYLAPAQPDRRYESPASSRPSTPPSPGCVARWTDSTMSTKAEVFRNRLRGGERAGRQRAGYSTTSRQLRHHCFGGRGMRSHQALIAWMLPLAQAARWRASGGVAPIASARRGYSGPSASVG